MKNEILILIDLSKNCSKFELNKSYIYLNQGSINSENCLQIKLNQLNAIKKSSYYILFNLKKKIVKFGSV
tara:strand:+ start:490 stop:699 length:210 start_codon:yes stop_codon:yes gene_type:complete